MGDGEQWSFAVSLFFKHEGGGFPTRAALQAHSAQVPCSRSQRKGCGSSADNSDVMGNLLSEAELNLSLWGILADAGSSAVGKDLVVFGP